MNKKIIAFFVGTLLLAMVQVAKAVDIRVWTINEVTATSETFKGPLYVGAVYLSTPTENSIGHYAVVLATPCNPSSTWGMFTSDTKKSPALVFSSTNTASGVQFYGANEAINYGDDGILISTDCTVYKSQAASGEAFKVFLKYRR